MPDAIVLVLCALLLSLIVAGLFMLRGRSPLGVFLGLLPHLLLQLLYRALLASSIRDCIDSACAAAGLPPGCEIAEFGCSEWSGVGAAIMLMVGMAGLVAYLIGVGVIALVLARRRASQA